MCGRFHLSSSPNQILGHYGLDLFALSDDSGSNGEVFPGTEPFVVVDGDSTPEIRLMFWDFRRLHVRGRRKQPINARSEKHLGSGYCGRPRKHCVA